jgi:DNA-binding transcriptional MerR regulator
MNTKTYTIQEVSVLTDLPGSTLRYYEEEGLLEPVERKLNGHRRFNDADLLRIQTIKRLRLTGMTIDAMRNFLGLYRGGPATARQRREILEAHRKTVEARISELQDMLGFIDYKIAMYRDEEAQIGEIPVPG